MIFRLFGLEVRLGKPQAPSAAAPAPPPPDPAASLLDVISGLSEGLVVVDPSRKILFCNESVAPLLNRPPGQTAGLPLWEVLRHREVGDLLDRALREGREQSREVSFPLPRETLWLVRARPHARGVVLAFSDTTRLRRLEALRRDFVANVSHELKTPLTSLRAALETLLDGALDDKTHAREFLETAQTQVERLQRLIDDLLTLSRLERDAAPAPGKASLQDTAARVISALKPLAARDQVALESRFPPAPLPLALPPDELTQVLMNLLDNAIKFNRPGGRVDLSAAARQGAAEITVKDTGVGIPAEDQPRVFERFYRVDKARSRDTGGTGLGLAIVKHIVESRGGKIRLDSEPGRGSEFTVLLPLAREE